MSWWKDCARGESMTDTYRPRWNLAGERIDAQGNVIEAFIPKPRESADGEEARDSD